MSALQVLSATAESFASEERREELLKKDFYSPKHCRKQASPSRSLRHIEDKHERERQGFFVYNPFISPPQRMLKRLFDDTDSFSDMDDKEMAIVKRSRESSGASRSPRRKDRDRYRHRSREGRERKVRTPSPSIHVQKVDPGPGAKALEGTSMMSQAHSPSAPHPNPHRFALFEALLKRRKVIPLPGRPGAPIDVTFYPGSDLLTDEEFEVCCVLRLTPQQYFASRKTLVENHRRIGFYRKSAAQKMLKIDVNKTGKLYDFFQENRWLPKDEVDKNYNDPEDTEV